MKRGAFVSVLGVVVAIVVAGSAFAQSRPATGATPAQVKSTTGSPTPAPAAPAKFVPPVKGVATIEILPKSKIVGKEIVTEVKIKNTSSGAIHLLKVDELWYDRKRAMITNGTERYKKPFMPGEIITVTVKSPLIGTPDADQFMFSHANGKVDAKKVKKIE